MQWVIVVLLAIIALGVWAIWDELCAVHRATHLMRNELVHVLRTLSGHEEQPSGSQDSEHIPKH